jgi:hypothetical protein
LKAINAKDSEPNFVLFQKSVNDCVQKDILLNCTPGKSASGNFLPMERCTNKKDTKQISSNKHIGKAGWRWWFLSDN